MTRLLESVPPDASRVGLTWRPVRKDVAEFVQFGPRLLATVKVRRDAVRLGGRSRIDPQALDGQTCQFVVLPDRPVVGKQHGQAKERRFEFTQQPTGFGHSGRAPSAAATSSVMTWT